jgi:hypothetical protein
MPLQENTRRCSSISHVQIASSQINFQIELKIFGKYSQSQEDEYDFA